MIEAAFEEEVNLEAEVCSACGVALVYSTEHVGAIGTADNGMPEVRVYHLRCAPADLQAAHKAGEAS